MAQGPEVPSSSEFFGQVAPFFLPDDPYFANFDVCYSGSHTNVKICLESTSHFEFLQMPIQGSPLHQSQLLRLCSVSERRKHWVGSGKLPADSGSATAWGGLGDAFLTL